jgi:hypothetical protein
MDISIPSRLPVARLLVCPLIWYQLHKNAQILRPGYELQQQCKILRRSRTENAINPFSLYINDLNCVHTIVMTQARKKRCLLLAQRRQQYSDRCFLIVIKQEADADSFEKRFLEVNSQHQHVGSVLEVCRNHTEQPFLIAMRTAFCCNLVH